MIDKAILWVSHTFHVSPETAGLVLLVVAAVVVVGFLFGSRS